MADPTKEKENSQQEPSETSSEERNSPSEEESPTTQTRESSDGHPSEEREIEIAAAEGALNFDHPLLKGKTPEEIEALVETQEAAIRDQNTELNRYHEELQASSQASAGAPRREEPEPEEDYEDSFLAPHLRTLEGRLSRKLEQMVEPLREQITSTRTQSVRDQLRSQFRHFERLEPHIDKLLRQQGIKPSEANEQTLRTLYFTAVGFARENGVNLDEAPAGEETRPSGEEPKTREREEPMGIPQHRPSSSPMPKGEEKKQRRKLTEGERKLADFYGMTDEEYLNHQNAEVDEVVSPGFSKENW